VLNLALLAGAVGFFFSLLHEIRQQSTQALVREPIIATNKKEVVAPPARPTAKLNIEINHQFTQARASIWLDNQPVYSRALRADPKSHLLFFRKYRATNQMA